MMKATVIVLSVFLVALGSSCKDSCMNCTIEHYEDLSVIAEVNDICGNEDELSVEESNLSVDYRCVQCVVFLQAGNHDTGILCGTREYTDSVESSNTEGAIQANVPYSCEIFSDTLIITCHPA
jgi:hypothetical protein